MRIFGTSDIHGNFKTLTKLIKFIRRRRDIDVVVFCGDIAKGYRWSSVSELAELQDEDYRYFKGMIEDIKNKKVYFIRGNHDVFLPDNSDINFLPNAYKQGIEKDLIPFEMMYTDFYKTNREGTEKDLRYELSKIDYISGKVIVTHKPPLNVLDLGYTGNNYGSKAIREMILNNEPLVVFCGHIHEAYGTKMLGNTTVINCACSAVYARGVIFDTETKTCEEILI